MLMRELQRGTSVAFWDDEMRLDLAQEAALARLEGRSELEAIREYEARERKWHAITTTLPYSYET